MKLKLIKTAAALLVAATVLAGCKFDGTTASFKNDERDVYTPTNDRISSAGSIGSYTTYIATADSKSEIQVVIKSEGILDEKSIDAAFDVYAISENTTNKYWAPVRGSTFTKTRKTIDVSKNSSGQCTTTVVYEVDLSKVEKNYVAVKADATKLKEKTGKLILNYDSNDKCGEESDSIVGYIKIDAVKSGDTTTATTVLDWDPLNFQTEDFSPNFSIGGTPTPTIDVDTDSKPTGKIKYITATPTSFYNGTETVYAKDFAAELGKIYTFRTLPIGASKWTESALTFTWDADHNQYVATTDVIAYGTRYCLGVKPNNKLEWAAAKDVYGHTPRISWRKNKNSYTASSYYNRFLEDSEYIIQAPNNDIAAVTYSPISANVSAIASVQDDIIDFTVGDSYVIFMINTLNYNRKIRFGEYKDFVITDQYLNKIKTKAPVVYSTDSDGEVYAVLVEIENKNLDMTNFIYWVGEGTTIKANSLTGNKEVKFGTPKVQIDDTLLGYSVLNN